MRIDLLRGYAYHAADREPLLPASLVNVEPEKIGALRFALYPSLGILRSCFPAFTIWAMNSGERPLQPVTDWQREDVLVIRPALDLFVLALPAGGADFLQTLDQRLSLAEAVEAALCDNPEFDLERNLGGALTNGVVTDLIQLDRHDNRRDNACRRKRALSERMLSLLRRVHMDVVILLARLSVAATFWRSGHTKVDGFHVTDTAVYLFETEYRLPLIAPWLAAHLAAISEHLFPALLVFGLFSRLSALALLGMTLVIEIFVYPDAWPTHGLWAVALILIIRHGPGLVSLDRFLFR